MKKNENSNISIKKAVKVFLIVLLCIIFFRLFIIEFYRVPSNSMSQTLLTGDFLIVSKISLYLGLPPVLPFVSIKNNADWRIWLSQPEKGDVIAFETSDQELSPIATYYVKRIAALPGDTIRLTENNVLINGTPHYNIETAFSNISVSNCESFDSRIFSEYNDYRIPYSGMTVQLDSCSIRLWKHALKQDGSIVKIIKDSIFVDNQFAAQYTFKNDFYFVLGDNKDLSRDSRHWGFLIKNRIIGKPLFVYWSSKKDLYSGETSVRYSRIGRWVN